MSEKLSPYECQFTIDERKKLTGAMLRNLRKANGYTQKDVADFIQVKQGAYNTYENGRTEPPIEILVRLSFLYEIPIDTIVQKERFYRTQQDLLQMMEQNRETLKEIEKQMQEAGEDNQLLKSMRDAMYQLINQMETLSEQDELQKEINDI